MTWNRRILPLCFIVTIIIQHFFQFVNTLSCKACDPTSCVEPSCVGGIVRESCGCCKVCAKLENEICGGMFDIHGLCDKNLTCVIQAENGELLTENESGICRSTSSLTPAYKCYESTYYGCNFTNGNCVCKQQIACTNPFQFSASEICLAHKRTIQGTRPECRNVRCSIPHSRSCPDDSKLIEGYTPPGECCPTPSRCECRPQKCSYYLCRSGTERILVSSGTDKPGSCCDIYQCVPHGEEADCAEIKCITAPLDSITCPSDSVVIRNPLTFERCCPGEPICQCLKRKCPRPPTCSDGMRAKVAYRGNETPGSCCDDYICAYGKIFVGCKRDGTHYEHGEIFQGEKCETCECIMGLSHCFHTPCPPLTCKDIDLAPDGCCPKCLDDVDGTFPIDPHPPCKSENASKSYLYGETWSIDACTHCKCAAGGQVQCKAAFCERSSICSNLNDCALKDADCSYGFAYDHGVCRSCHCRSDILGCAPLTNCQITCPLGYVVDQSGCSTCQCRQTPCRDLPSSCHKQCPYGYKQNKKQCERCKCRACPALNSCLKQCKFGFVENKYGCSLCKCRSARPNATTQISPISAHMCTDPLTAVRYDDGETWTGDPCRMCLCRGGEVMCDAVRCPAVTCKKPKMDAGSCCPVCSETIFPTPPLKSCRRSNGQKYAEGEIWMNDQCTSCTCHSGHVMCSSTVCPPIPCENPVYDLNFCCPKCLGNSVNANLESQQCRLENESLLANGELFKTDACTSCVCRNGIIKCFTELCPNTSSCTSPVLLRGDCCPKCLGESFSHPCVAADGAKYLHQESWNKTGDGCVVCVCKDGKMECADPQCPPVHDNCRRLYKRPGECCEICVLTGTEPPSKTWPETNQSSQKVAMAVTISLLCILVLILVAVVVYFVRRGCPDQFKYTRGDQTRSSDRSHLDMKSSGTNSLGGKSNGTARSDITIYFSSDEERVSFENGNASSRSHSTPSTSSEEEKLTN